MPTTRLIKNAWNAGELSQHMDGRTDLNKYYNGASKLINGLVLPHGGFTKRPGTIFKAISPSRANLTAFEFSVGDALVLEWNNLLLRFYKDKAQVFRPWGTEDLAAFDSATGDGSLIAHWLCDDHLATTAVLDDTIAGSHDGVASANTDTITTTDAEETANEAFLLGDSEVITITDHTDFSFGDGTDDSPFSLAAWVFYTSDGAAQQIISKYETGKTEWFLEVDSTDKPRFRIFDTSAGAAQYLVADDAIADGWHYIIATYDGRGGSNAADGMKIYVDWVLISTSAFTEAAYVAMEELAEDVIIGAYKNTSRKWVGKVDNVAVFSKELSVLDIASLAGNDSTTPHSIVSPYTTAQAFGIHYTQSADVMYIAHNDVYPQKLSRFGDATWIIEDVPFTGGPFLTENTTAASLVGFASTGGTARSGYYFPTDATGTLTASGEGNSPFNTNMVGGLWLVKHTRDEDNSTTTFAKDTNVVPTAETFVSGAVFIKGDATVTFEPIASGSSAFLWRKTSRGNWQKYRGFQGATAFSWTEDEDDVLYAMTRSAGAIKGTLTAKEAINYGVVKITSFISATIVSVKVVDKVLSDNSTDNAVTTSMWAEGAWSTYRGFPRTVGFHEDRLWWASSTNDPDKKWSSQTGDYENMAFTTGLDNEAVTAIVKDNEVSQIQWMMSRRVMAIGAANREYSFSAQNPEDPITPLDKKSTPQTGFSSGSIQPVMLNDSIFFLQRQGKKLGAMKFDSITENFIVDDATLLAYGLLDSPPTNIAVSRSPDSLIWVVRTDGVLPTFTYEPKEEVSGWGRQIFGNSAAVETPTGFVESVAVIHGTTEDEIWVNVRRVIDTSTVYYTELFAPRDWGSDIEDAIFGIDSVFTYDSAETEFIDAGIDHLVGETVSVFADGVVFDDAVVNVNGYIDLKKATVITGASVVQVGLPYTMKGRSMRLAVPQVPSALQTKIKRVVSVATRYIRSLLGSAGTEYGGTEYLRPIEAAYSIESADTDENTRATEGGFNEDNYTTILSDDPVPFTALATVTEVEV